MKKKLFILTILLITVFSSIYADCQACWELRCVKLTINNGNEIVGYILWNKKWLAINFNDTLPKESFHDSIVSYYNKSLNTKLIIYKEIVSFDSLLNRRPIAIDKIDTIDIFSIKKIIPHTGKYQGLEGAGEIQVITTKIANLLKTKPVAMYFIHDSNPEIYFISYNNAYNKNKLIEISETEYYNRIKEYEQNKIIILQFYWD